MLTPKAENADLHGAPLRQRAACWTRYWRSGALHSCQVSDNPQANYDGEIAAFWTQVFADLPEHARVIEPCCGNAPLGRLLLEQHARGAAVSEVVAVDIAAVAPAWLDTAAPAVRARLRVHPGTNVAALPFESAAFDLCMSQFGLEYLPAAALDEIARVLRPRGFFAAVVHHRDSLTAQIAREEVGHGQWLREQSGLNSAAAALVQFLQRAQRSIDPPAVLAGTSGHGLRQAFNLAMQAVGARIDDSRYPDLLHEQREQVMAAVQRALHGHLEQASALLQASREQLDDALLRQQELLDAALDEAGLLAWTARLSPRQRSLRPLHFSNGAIAGWAVQLLR